MRAPTIITATALLLALAVLGAEPCAATTRHLHAHNTTARAAARQTAGVHSKAVQSSGRVHSYTFEITQITAAPDGYTRQVCVHQNLVNP